MIQWIVYKHTSMRSGKSYIGITKHTIEKRWKEHCYASKNNKQNNHFYNALTLYGFDNWQHEILVSNIDSIEEARALEKHYIKLYDTFENGYNSTIGGEGVDGYIYSDKELQKMSEARRGRNGNKVYTFYNPELDILEKQIHPMDLAKKYGILPGNIWYVINDKSKQAMGWYLYDESCEEYTSKILHTFEHSEYGVVRGSISYMADTYKLSKRNMRRVARGERVHHNGWTLPGNQGKITTKERKPQKGE